MIDVDNEATKTTAATLKICGHFVGPAGYGGGYVDTPYWRWSVYLACGIARRFDPAWSKAFPRDGTARKAAEQPPE